MDYRLYTLLFLFLGSISCSEPYSFDSYKEITDVVDGRVSTIPGKSHISIYRVSNDGIIERIDDLEVFVMSESGLRYDFAYDMSTVSYRPIDSEFVAEVGESYKMMALGSESQVYESEFDVISKQIEFDIAFEDTVIRELNEFNRVIETKGTSAIAVIPPQEDNFYLKLDFKYSYLNYFDESVIISKINNEGFVLLKCDGNLDCFRSFKIPVGFKEAYWKFRNPDPGCDGVPNCPNPSSPTETCCLPCCFELQFWDADYEISLKALSESSYRYWEDVKRLRDNDGLIFDTNPFPADGNISCTGCENKVVGLFRSYSETLAIVNKKLE